jgi:hypothetical protein
VPENGEILAFDWGTTIVGILDVNSNEYTAYRHRSEMPDGARRIFFAIGTIVSFNGDRRDLVELAKLLALPPGLMAIISGHHDDMADIISRIRWPPDPGTSPICGKSLDDTYRYYFGNVLTPAPLHIQDDYEANNWRDCHMTAELWKKWKREGLTP